VKLKPLSAGEAAPLTGFAPDFRYCVAVSVALHLLFFAFHGLHFAGPEADKTMEIDFTYPFEGHGPPKLGAPKKLVPEAKLPPAPAPEPVKPEPPKPVAPEPPKNWVLPGPDTQKVVPPKPDAPPPTKGGAENGTGTSPLVGGHGEGFDYGVPNGSLNPGYPAGMIKPKLLNKDEVLANLRKYYPERERIAGHEGLVVVDIHLDAAGAILSVEVLQAATPLFDAAAVKVAHIMRFAPAQTADGRGVAAKVRERMQFKLTDE
jgi:protein TonB